MVGARIANMSPEDFHGNLWRPSGEGGQISTDKAAETVGARIGRNPHLRYPLQAAIT
jgi:hypothetical protein